MSIIDEIFEQKNREIENLRKELAAKEKQISELHTLLRKSDDCRQKYVLRWILSMKTPEDRIDPLSVMNQA